MFRAMHLGYVKNMNIDAMSWVNIHVFFYMILFMKQSCCIVFLAFVDEMEARFLTKIVMDALVLVYHQY